jgi:hypothetical protein
MRERQTVLARPAEAILRPGARAIFGADPTPVAEAVDGLEDRRVVDLALIRLMT